MKPIFRYSITILYVILIAYFSLTSSSNLPKLAITIPYFDKFAHALMYSGLAVLLSWSFNLQELKKRYILSIILLASLYGFAMEVLQHTFINQNRSYDTGDIIANIVGAILGMGFYIVFYPKLEKLFVKRS